MSAEALGHEQRLLMGLPGVAYLSSIADAGWTAIRSGGWRRLTADRSRRLRRRYSVACGAITMPDFFSRRYEDKKRLFDGASQRL